MKREERGFLESACMYMGGNYKVGWHPARKPLLLTLVTQST